MKKATLLLTSSIILSGCIGWNIPQPFQGKPYTYFAGGDQIGRDTLENRILAANSLFPLKGLHPNEVLTYLGQPQQIHVIEREIAEDWYYVYYKKYAAYMPRKIQNKIAREKGTFIVRIYQDKVLDVVNAA